MKCLFFSAPLLFSAYLSFSTGFEMKLILENPFRAEYPLRSLLAKIFTRAIPVDEFSVKTHRKLTLHLIDKLLQEVDVFCTEEYAKVVELKNHVYRVEAIADSLNHSAGHGSNEPPSLIQTACLNYLRANTPGHIHREIARESSLRPLLGIFQDLKTERDIVMWSILVILVQVKASVLGQECISVVLRNKTELPDVLASYRDLNMKKFWEIAAIMKIEAGKLDAGIDLEGLVKPYVTDYARMNPKQSHQDFANEIYKYVAVTFFWRDWLVLVYGKKAIRGIREDWHSRSKFSVKIEESDFERVVFVLSPDSVVQATTKIGECFNETVSAKVLENCSCAGSIERLRSHCGDNFADLLCFARDDGWGAWASAHVVYKWHTYNSENEICQLLAVVLSGPSFSTD